MDSPFVTMMADCSLLSLFVQRLSGSAVKRFSLFKQSFSHFDLCILLLEKLQSLSVFQNR